MNPARLATALALAGAASQVLGQMPPTPSTDESLVRKATHIVLATVTAAGPTVARLGETMNGTATLRVDKVVKGSSGPLLTAYYCRESSGSWTRNTVLNLSVGDQRLFFIQPTWQVDALLIIDSAYGIRPTATLPAISAIAAAQGFPPGALIKDAQPDLRVSRDQRGTTWAGAYSFYTAGAPGDAPILEVPNDAAAAAVGETRLFVVDVWNPGGADGDFHLLVSPRGLPGWNFSFRNAAGEDVTAAATGDGLNLRVAVGGSVRHTLRVTRVDAAEAAVIRVDVTCPVNGNWDAAACRTHVPAATVPAPPVAGSATPGTILTPPVAGSATPGTLPIPVPVPSPTAVTRPDLLFARPDGTSFVGGGVYNSVEQQRRLSYAAVGTPQTYQVKVRNAASQAGVLRLSGAMGTANWTVRYTAPDGTDVTPLMATDAGYSLPLAAGAEAAFSVVVAPVVPACENGTFTVTVRAADSVNGTLTDAIELVTNCVPAWMLPRAVLPGG